MAPIAGAPVRARHVVDHRCGSMHAEAAYVRRRQLATKEDLDGVRRDPRLNLLADQLERHRVEVPADLDMVVQADPAALPVRILIRRRQRRQQGRLVELLEQRYPWAVPARYSSHNSASVTSGRRISRCPAAPSGIGRRSAGTSGGGGNSSASSRTSAMLAGRGQPTSARRARVKYSLTASWLSRRLCPLACCGSPWPNRSRKTSRVFRIDTLLPKHPDPLLLGKEPTLPSVEDCQRKHSQAYPHQRDPDHRNR